MILRILPGSSEYYFKYYGSIIAGRATYIRSSIFFPVTVHWATNENWSELHMLMKLDISHQSSSMTSSQPVHKSLSVRNIFSKKHAVLLLRNFTVESASAI